ncbi:MAG TPA: UDP-2,3-diacylglucosamine diphosphatase [Gammaproteobacteria bacterium]|jgi:UDP-2,3-diacylglucosamine hydrolase|nr:UDP-2,3-diacylglucosamine diphosphatase [Gammaproteobacteria bacterium]
MNNQLWDLGHDNRKSLFISDLHLDQQYPETTQQFLQLLVSCDASVDALYILGDLFEYWLGDDDDAPFYQKIIDALKTTTNKGLAIYFMHGNRDFMIGKSFLQKTGCQLLPEEQKIMLYGTPVLLMHGDTLCTQDVVYLKWRKYAKNPTLQKLALICPLAWRRWFANHARKKSHQHTRSIAMTVMDVDAAAVRQVMQKHQVSYLIHGHTHRPGTHEVGENETRIVLGAWHERGYALVWSAGGDRRCLRFMEKPLSRPSGTLPRKRGRG